MKIKSAGKYVTWIEDADGIEVPVTNDIVTGLMNLGAQAQRRACGASGPLGAKVEFDDIDYAQALRDAAKKETGN